MIGKRAIAPLIIIVLALTFTKLKLIWQYGEEEPGPYSRIDRSTIEFVYNAEEQASFVIDKNVGVVNQVDRLKAKTATIFVMILSAPKNAIQRQITRRMLSQEAARSNSTLKWAFIIGQTSQELQVELVKEMAKHGDILQLSVEESYRNLAYKSLATFAWIYENFQHDLQWIVKMDDDLEVKMDKIIASLPDGDSNAIHCPALMINMSPTRHSDGWHNKIHVTPEEWPESFQKYPGFCNGYVYALKPKLAMQLSAISRHTPYLPLDDVYVTGVLRDRLDSPKSPLRLMTRFSFASSAQEWALNCPFLGVAYYTVVQDMAYERGKWPWGMVKEVLCIVMERYLGLYKCSVELN